MKTTSNGRWPPNFIIRLIWPKHVLYILQMKMTSNGRQPQNIKSGISCFLDHTQILNLDLGDQIKFFKYFKWRRPPMEEVLKIFKVEYLSNHLLDLPKILSLTSDVQIMMYKSYKWRQPQNIQRETAYWFIIKFKI